ncbi:MAG: SMP-30/gluconolactonase/LRE family protein [Mucinivorans sp.]
MKKILTIAFAFFAFGVVDAQKPYDLMSEWSFTKGIEGPVADSEGYVYAVNFEREGTIGRVDPRTGRGEIFVDLRAVVSDSATANGLRFGDDSLLYVAEYRGHNLLSIDMDTKEIRVVAHSDKMAQPNDLAVATSGTIYLSDPAWSKGTGTVWMYRSGRLKMILDGLSCTNGIEVSPDGERLYVGLSNDHQILVYRILPSGLVTDGRVFADFEDGGLDGMRTDIKGNLYAARYDMGQVVVLSPAGKTIQTIDLKGKKASNLTFSGRKVYVTMADRGCFEVFDAQYVGRE